MLPTESLRYGLITSLLLGVVGLGRMLTLGEQTELTKAQGLGTNVSSLQEVRVQEMGARLAEAAVSSGSGRDRTSGFS